jgi:hypothetical protein
MSKRIRDLDRPAVERLAFEEAHRPFQTTVFIGRSAAMSSIVWRPGLDAEPGGTRFTETVATCSPAASAITTSVGMTSRRSSATPRGA